MKRPHQILIITVLATGMTTTGATAQMAPFGDWMPRRGTVSYDMILSRDWSPMSIRMIGSLTASDFGLRQRHCLQPSYSPAMACQITVNGQPNPPHMMPPPPPVSGWGGGRYAPGAYGPGPYPGGSLWSFPGGSRMPYWRGQQLPGFAPPPFRFPGGAPGPDFEMSGDWEWQGWRIRGTFRYSQAYW